MTVTWSVRRRATRGRMAAQDGAPPLIAQMPFGDVVEPVGEKTVVPVEERVRVIGL